MCSKSIYFVHRLVNVHRPNDSSHHLGLSLCISTFVTDLYFGVYSNSNLIGHVQNHTQYEMQ